MQELHLYHWFLLLAYACMLGSSCVKPVRNDEAHSQLNRARKRTMIDDTNSDTDVVVEETGEILYPTRPFLIQTISLKILGII